MTPMLTFYARSSHYADHLAPIAAAMGHEVTSLKPRTGTVVVASYVNAVECAPLPVIHVDHGAGQSYDGDERSRGHGSYSGGEDLDHVLAFLVPNPRVAKRWAARYPEAGTYVVGSALLDELATIAKQVIPPKFTIAVAPHWECPLIPETRNAWPLMEAALPSLIERFHVIGHGHPRIFRYLIKSYRRHGIEPVEDIRDVVARASCLVWDNSSIGYMWAALDRPAVVVNAPWYRRDVHHGLRFWDEIPGILVDRSEDIADAVAQALTDPPSAQSLRGSAVRQVYPQRGRAVELSVAAIQEVLGGPSRSRSLRTSPDDGSGNTAGPGP